MDIKLEGWNLHRAATENRSDIAIGLLDRGDGVDEIGFPPDHQGSPSASSTSRKRGATPLYFAAASNSLEVALLLVEHGADVDNGEALGRFTPLHVAALKDSINVANMLTAHGANIEAEDGTGWTPLSVAAYKKSFDVARWLIDVGANTAGIDLSWMDSSWHKSKRGISKWWKNNP